MGANLSSSPEFERFVAEHPAALVFFAIEDCGVCRVLQPRLRSFLGERFPRMAQATVDCDRAPRLASGHSVFAAPTVVVYMDGCESARFSRGFGLGELADAIERPYRLLFG